jgi:HAD superfamily hydrolase (TIGR01509 family)
MLASLCQEKDPRIPFEDAWAKYPLKKKLFEERMHSDGVVLPEVAAFLREVHSKYKTAVVTSSARSEVEPVLAKAGLLPYLDTAVYGDEVDRHKPSPDPYLLAAQRLGVKKALVVEDSPAGCESGRAAGFDVIRITRQAEMCGDVLRALQHQHDEPHQRAAE